MSNRAGGRDIWTSRRATAADPWQPPTRVGELDSVDSDWAPAVSLDGLRIWFASDRDSVRRGQIWRATRASRAAAWDPPAPVAELASDSVDFAPAVDATETTMYAQLRSRECGRDRRRRRLRHLRVDARRTGRDVGLAGAGRRASPATTTNTIRSWRRAGWSCSSRRCGRGWATSTGRRAARSRSRSRRPSPLDDLNSNAYDSDTTLSADLGTLMFSSTRSGNAEIYEATALR